MKTASPCTSAHRLLTIRANYDAGGGDPVRGHGYTRRLPRLLVGPLLRYVGQTQATVWVETDASCEVEVLRTRARTFEIAGHHFGLVVLEDLEPGTVTEYAVALDGDRVWPQPEPWTLAPDEDPEGFGADALWAYSRRLQAGIEPWPDCVLMIGDQVYADEVSPETLEFIRARRDTSQPPGEEIADFEEYTRLYRESWTEPDIRWLLATVPSVMIFDDHDVIDDWNISWQWLRDARSEPWWDARITGAFMSYWVYQHIGNLTAVELAEEPMFQTAIAKVGDVGPDLEEFDRNSYRESWATRWSSFLE